MDNQPTNQPTHPPTNPTDGLKGRESSLEQRNAAIRASLATAQRKLDDATAALQSGGSFLNPNGGDGRSIGMSAAAQLADQQLADALEELNGQ